MGRLIDDIALKASITANEILETNKTLEDIIDDQPTAYDVEAVVKELEEYREENKHEVNSGFIEVCIDIVRRGGVNQQRNDTKKLSVKKIVIRTGNRTIYVCPSCYTPLTEGMQHCYKCGQKICWSVKE